MSSSLNQIQNFHFVQHLFTKSVIKMMMKMIMIMIITLLDSYLKVKVA